MRLALLALALWGCAPADPVPSTEDGGRLGPQIDGRVVEATPDEGVGDAAGEDGDIDASEAVDNDAAEAEVGRADVGLVEALSLNSIVPNRGDARGGVSVRIVGAGFTPEAVFFFGELECGAVEVSSPNHARCAAPAQAPGVVALRVVDPASGREVVLPEAFTYFEGLSITNITPDRGRVAGGAPILIEGAGLIEGTEARIGGRKLLEVTYVEGGMRGELPPGDLGPQDVRVMNPNGAVTRADGFFYYEPVEINAVEPSASPVEGGGRARILGAGLLSEGEITFGEAPCEILDADEGRRWVEIRVPPHPVGLVDVSARNANGEITQPGGFLYYEAAEGLSVAGIVPPRGSTLGGEAILIGGAGFDEATTVSFDGRPLTCEGRDAHRIECLTPPGAPGAVPVVVEGGGSRVEVPGGFTYFHALVLTSVTPAAVAISGGALLVIEGQGFERSTEIYLGEAPLVELEYVDETQIFGRAPPHPVGAVNARAVSPHGEAVIEGGLLYFDPGSRYGGLWGEPIAGAVNVTVRDAGSGDPIEDAAVLCLTDDGVFEREGLTNADGQRTFSGFALRGPLSLTAAKEGYQVTTVEGVEVENVTVYLEMNEGDEGGPPSGDLLSSLSGTISGLDRLPKPRQEGRVNIAVVETTHTNPYNRSRLPDPGAGGLLTEDGAFTINARAGELALIVTAGEVDRVDKEAYLAGNMPWITMRRRMTPLAMGIRRFISASPSLALVGLHVEVDHMTDQEIFIDLDNPPLGEDPGPAYYAVLPRLDLGAEGYWELDTDAFGLSPSLVMPLAPSLAGWDPDVRFYLIGFAFSATSDNRPYAVSIARTRDVEGGVFITPFVGTPRIITPDGQLGPGRRIEWTMDSGYFGPVVPPSAYLVEISEPTLGPPKPLWRYIAPPGQTSLELPRLPRLAGETGLGQGTMILEVMPFLMEGDFEFDGFTYNHFNQLRWRSWAEARVLFVQ